MKNLDTKLRAIKLRAQGNSLDTIAELVGGTTTEVADWLIDCEEEVANLKAMELDALREAFLISKRKRLEQLTARLEQIRAEIDTRGFADVPMEKLLELEEDTRTGDRKRVFWRLHSQRAGAQKGEGRQKIASPQLAVAGAR